MTLVQRRECDHCHESRPVDEAYFIRIVYLDGSTPSDADVCTHCATLLSDCLKCQALICYRPGTLFAHGPTCSRNEP